MSRALAVTGVLGIEHGEEYTRKPACSPHCKIEVYCVHVLVVTPDTGCLEQRHGEEETEREHTYGRGNDTYGGCFPDRHFSPGSLPKAVKRHRSSFSPRFFLPTALECLRRVERVKDPGAPLIR